MARPLNLASLARLGLGLSTALGCQPTVAPEQRPLELVVSTPPEVLDPRAASDAISFRVSRLLHAGLFRLGEDLLPEPYVAESFRWRDPLTLQITLRQDVRFDDGQPVSAEDVVASVRAFGADGSRQKRVVEAIGEVTALSPREVQVTLARPHGTLLTDLELPILRASQARGPVRPDGELDGLGPYRIEAREHGALTLAPREGSPLPMPRHRLVVRTVRDENARAMRLLAGKADIVHNGLAPTLWPALTTPQSGLSLQTRAAANLTYWVVRHGQGGPLDDLRVRQALSLAIDRESYCRFFYHGHARPAHYALPPSHWVGLPAPAPLAPEQARQQAQALLAAHGPLQRPIVLSTSTDRLRLLVARTMAQDLAALGVPIRIEALELGTLLSRLSRGEFELALLQIPELAEPNILKTFLHTHSVPPQGANRGRYTDAELDRLLDLGEREAELEARRRHYSEVLRRLDAQLPIIPLWHEDQIAITSRRAHAFVPTAVGRYDAIPAL